jgi:hypothetical protein
MQPQMTIQLIEVHTDSEDHEGCLVLADGRLTAVLVRLADPVYEEPLLGSWYLESGLGAALEVRHDVFASLEVAVQAIGADLTTPLRRPRPG